MIGVIGGSGLYEIEGVVINEVKKISTPFGDPSDSYRIVELSSRKIVFLPRHGSPHHIPPHKINYRANIWGFKELGVERVISLGAVGSLSPEIGAGTIIVPDQIIDMTKGRDSTFYDSDEVVHIDFTEPYCPELREYIFRAGKKSGIELKESGTYVCVSGPRLETKAEIIFFSGIGADAVGMTAMPEASLARETELCFAGINVVTNYAAGITEKKLTTTEVIEVMKRTSVRLKELLKEAFNLIPIERKCACKEALKKARM
ncbi:MAG: methylthioadenosine phosphorylase [Thermodesulfovibrio sp. RBG_19FT_COMBO_41_18]|nr:MAG: methylthioadenosine phosphorylase [Thermodesulfovibrio sp. RBG_19FT_COMBO_41_18]